MTGRRAFIGLLLLLLAIGALLLYVSPAGNRFLDGIGTGPERETLTYVPADTVFVLGGLEPVPWQDFMDAFAPEYAGLKEVDWDALIGQQQRFASNESPAVRMLGALFLGYMRGMWSGGDRARALGIGKRVDVAVYAVGFLPVMRIKLQDADAFNAFLERAETAARIEPTLETLDGARYRAYSFNREGTLEPVPADLAIAVHEGYGVISVIGRGARQNVLEEIVGVRKPAESLGRGDTLSARSNANMPSIRRTSAMWITEES